jgi:antitoxin (DNA-binding transcriptional repressor) of toxin-antitoxin stability system
MVRWYTALVSPTDSLLHLRETSSEMQEVTPEQAKQILADLIDAAIRGEHVVIARDDQHAVQLVPVTRPLQNRHAGTARGLIVMAADFDAPLADFDEYTS